MRREKHFLCDKLKFNDDGSLTLDIQYDSPGPDKESNWLPAPDGMFTLTMRCYAPSPQIVTGESVPPTANTAK